MREIDRGFFCKVGGDSQMNRDFESCGERQRESLGRYVGERREVLGGM